MGGTILSPHIVVVGMPAAGHVNPTVPLVRELVRGGVKVTYYTDEKFAGVVDNAGA